MTLAEPSKNPGDLRRRFLTCEARLSGSTREVSCTQRTGCALALHADGYIEVRRTLVSNMRLRCRSALVVEISLERFSKASEGHFRGNRLSAMCRNIRVLHHFEPPTTDEEIRAAALQYVRKVSGTQKPAATEEAAFARAIDEIATTTKVLLDSLRVRGPARTREGEREKARVRWARREGAIKSRAT